MGVRDGLRRIGEAARALLGRSTRYDQLLDHLPVGVYRTTPEGWIVEANPALARILGFLRQQDARGVRVDRFYISREDRESHLARLREEGACFTEFQLTTCDGRRIWVRDYPQPVRDARGEVAHYDGILVDVTERRRAEEERERLIADLRQALDRVRTLSNLLPICAYCKKIRDDQGYWSQIEQYISDHSDTRFSHGVCPECAAKVMATFRQGAVETPAGDPSRRFPRRD